MLNYICLIYSCVILLIDDLSSYHFVIRLAGHMKIYNSKIKWNLFKKYIDKQSFEIRMIDSTSRVTKKNAN